MKLPGWQVALHLWTAVFFCSGIEMKHLTAPAQTVAMPAKIQGLCTKEQATGQTANATKTKNRLGPATAGCVDTKRHIECITQQLDRYFPECAALDPRGVVLFS